MDKIIAETINIFDKKYPDPVTALHFTTPFELLVATILSAQTTDKQVNRVTENLFKKYHTPHEFSRLKVEELENEIKSIGLYRNKSKYIIEMSKLLLEKYKGKVPKNRKELMILPGVGRKTANVVLSSAFSINAIAVDTHVFRVSNRIGLASAGKPYDVEKQLMKRVPKKFWSKLHHWLIFHGRTTCKAQNPDCENCEINNYCHYYQQEGSRNE